MCLCGCEQGHNPLPIEPELYWIRRFLSRFWFWTKIILGGLSGPSETGPR